MRMVNDGSASEKNSPSLNKVLETSPSLQNLLWDVVISTRFAPLLLIGDIRKAFLQIRIRPEDRDLLRFHWVKDLETFEIEVLRFCRALFGLVQSPFLQGAVLEVHFDWIQETYPELHEIVAVIRRSLYVDDLIVGATDVDFLKTMKEKSVFIFKEASFDLHKWHSNVRELEGLGSSDVRETKLLGLLWDKESDLLAISFPDKPSDDYTKRKVLSFLAAIYDLFGMISPVTLKGKLIYRDVCDAKLPWDETITGVLTKRWRTFLNKLPTEAVSFLRSIVTTPETIDYVEFHVFSDASVMGVAAVLYAIVYQHSRMSQGLVASKS